MMADRAPLHTSGKYLFQCRECLCCHRFQHYHSEPEELVSAQQSLQQMAQQRVQDLAEVGKAIQAGDNAPDNEAARKFYAQANDLRLQVSKTDLATDQLKTRLQCPLKAREKLARD